MIDEMTYETTCLGPVATAEILARLAKTGCLGELVEGVARASGADCAMVNALGAGGRVRTLAVWADGSAVPNFDYDLAGTHTELAVLTGEVVLEQRLLEGRRNNPFVQEHGLDFCIAAPIVRPGGRRTGAICLFARRPLVLGWDTTSNLLIVARKIGALLAGATAVAPGTRTSA